MATLYDAAERGDFTDPPTRISGWYVYQTRAMAHRPTVQVRAIARLAIAELRTRGVAIRGDDEAGVNALAMALMFACGFLTAVPLTLALYLVVIS